MNIPLILKNQERQLKTPRCTWSLFAPGQSKHLYHCCAPPHLRQGKSLEAWAEKSQNFSCTVVIKVSHKASPEARRGPLQNEGTAYVFVQG